MVTKTRRRLLLAALVVVLAGLVPLLRANATHQQAVWEAGCTGSGGSVWALPPHQENVLVVQLSRPTYECRDQTGVLVSVRD